MLGQDSDPIGEFGRLNVVYHLSGNPKKGRNFHLRVNGVLDRSTTVSRGQMPPWSAPTCRRFGTKAVPRHRTPRKSPMLTGLTVICGVADNNGLFYGSGISLLA